MGTGTDMGDHELCTYFKTKKFALFKIISTNYINDITGLMQKVTIHFKGDISE